LQFLVLISRSDVPAAQPPSPEQREAESEHIRQLYAEGIVRQMWLRAEGGACMIAESQDAESLGSRLAALPLVRSGFLQAPHISALNPYPGFGPKTS
jgi:hypothetical protein